MTIFLLEKILKTTWEPSSKIEEYKKNFAVHINSTQNYTIHNNIIYNNITMECGMQCEYRVRYLEYMPKYLHHLNLTHHVTLVFTIENSEQKLFAFFTCISFLFITCWLILFSAKCLSLQEKQEQFSLSHYYLHMCIYITQNIYR